MHNTYKNNTHDNYNHTFKWVELWVHQSPHCDVYIPWLHLSWVYSYTSTDAIKVVDQSLCLWYCTTQIETVAPERSGHEEVD